AQHGYQITGVDQSLAMLQHARAKSAAISPPISWVHSRAVEFTSDQKFDAVLFMFTVLGYHIANQDVLGALQMARRHLVRGGLLLFDVWYGPAVLWQRPGERGRVIRSDTNTILRLTRGELNTRTHTCQVSYDLWKIVGDRVVSRTSEAHTVRFFFPEELRLILDISGFEILRIGAFPEWEKEPDETTWNVLVAAQTNPR
ncbi:MAG: class I SAM-dependent methyltransferase, partial [Verrucomicrobiae bacterium]|nr:class I SAM-dependent methyltransferase [Verrucomicrobiae bacterium]